jgi:hypothetical protein
MLKWHASLAVPVEKLLHEHSNTCTTARALQVAGRQHMFPCNSQVIFRIDLSKLQQWKGKVQIGTHGKAGLNAAFHKSSTVQLPPCKHPIISHFQPSAGHALGRTSAASSTSKRVATVWC